MKQKMNLANVFSSRVGVDVNVKNKTTFKNDKHDYNFVFFSLINCVGTSIWSGICVCLCNR